MLLSAVLLGETQPAHRLICQLRRVQEPEKCNDLLNMLEMCKHYPCQLCLIPPQYNFSSAKDFEIALFMLVFITLFV